MKLFVDGRHFPSASLSSPNGRAWVLPLPPNSTFPVGPKTASSKFDCTIDGLTFSGAYPGGNDPNLPERRYQQRTEYRLNKMELTPNLSLKRTLFTPNAFNPGGEPIYLEVPDGAMFGAISWTEYIPLDGDTLTDCASPGPKAPNVGISGVQIVTLGGTAYGMISVPESPSSTKINPLLGGAGKQKEKDDKPKWGNCINPKPGIYSVPCPLGRRGEGEPIMKVVDEDGNEHDRQGRYVYDER